MKKMLSLMILLGIMLLSACSKDITKNLEVEVSKSLSGSDVVGNLIFTSNVNSSGTLSASFEYNASTTRDIRVSIKNSSTWATVSEKLITVSGTGTRTENLSFSNLSVGGSYIVEVKMFTKGTWDALSQVSKTLSVTNTVTSKGFYVKDGKLYDANGYGFIMRGVNHPHAWFPDKLDTTFAGIASTKANTVRVVLSNGKKWTKTSKSELQNIIQKAKNNKLIAVLEVHDTTGYGEDSSACTLQDAVNYWLEMKDVLIGQEKYVVINIGNEPFGNNQSSSNWVNGHISAIQSLRNAGFTHTLMVDAPNWGQDWENIMKNNASTVFNGDSLKNTIFSVHMYEVYNTYDKVNSYISAFVNNKIPLVVGEFAAEHKGMDVKELDIMERCNTLGVGYLGWSWDGNDSSYGAIDIVNNWNVNSLTTWGNTLINGTNGIKNTSWKASVY